VSQEAVSQEAVSQEVLARKAAPDAAAGDWLAINTIRTLTIDAVRAARSGHPGAAMALAPVGYTLWNGHSARPVPGPRCGSTSVSPRRWWLARSGPPSPPRYEPFRAVGRVSIRGN
jgi:hypothetical protein